MRRGGERDVPLAGQHARGDVEPDPAGARQIDFGPGVQVGEIVLDLARPFDRIDVGAQLDEIARDEARGEPEMAQRSAPAATRSRGRIPRRSRSVSSGRLDARLHADDVADLVAQLGVELDQEIDRARSPRAECPRDISRTAGPGSMVAR